MVTIDLYWAIVFDCFFRNALTSLYVTIPLDDTVYKHNKYECLRKKTIRK